MFKIFLNNYRGFKNQEFEIRKMNILIGENSAGKSSLMKLLLALKQSIETPNDKEANLTLTGSYVDLGNYSEIIFNHVKRNKLTLGFKFYSEYISYYKREILGITPVLYDDDSRRNRKQLFKDNENNIAEVLPNPIQTETTVTYKLNSKLDQHGTIESVFFNEQVGEIALVHPKPTNIRSEDFIYSRSYLTLEFKDFISGEEYKFENVVFEKQGFLSIIVTASLRLSIENAIPACTDEKMKELIYRIGFLLITQNFIEDFLAGIEYHNPILSQPERFFMVRDPRMNYRVNNIEAFITVLSKKLREDPDDVAGFIEILRELELVEDLALNTDSVLPINELRVRINDLWSNISDVGYGVSLQIPLVFAAYNAEKQILNIPRSISVIRKNPFLLIEQPEVHLHPRLQAKLINVLCSLTKQTSYIIETHSEHILRKLQVLVKNNNNGLTSDDISIYYFSRDNLKMNANKHDINQDGRLSPPFPTGFFDNTYLLAKELLN